MFAHISEGLWPCPFFLSFCAPFVCVCGAEISWTLINNSRSNFGVLYIDVSAWP